MEIEDLAKLLTGCNINVKGDLVMEKHVEHEVANVEAGGIGIQIVGDKKPKDLMERKKRVRRKKVLQRRIQKRRIQKRSLP